MLYNMTLAKLNTVRSRLASHCALSHLACMQYTRYFCGSHPDCKPLNHHKGVMSQVAQQQAVNNFRNEYLVVGITERYEESLKLFKQLLPTYLSAVEGRSAPHRNKNPQRPKAVLSGHSKRLVQQGFDHQLYAIALELFEAKYRTCFAEGVTSGSSPALVRRDFLV